MRLPARLTGLPLAVAALTIFAPTTAPAQGYDMDCKLLLCLPGGFPDGCEDAHEHMMDRLRDGKSPIGTCSTPGGGTYDDYRIDYSRNGATSRNGWSCRDGARLYHDSQPLEANRTQVNVFCYTGGDSVRIGQTDRTYYTGITRPERTSLSVEMTFNAETETPYRTGPMRIDTGSRISPMTTVIYDQ